MSTVQVPLDLLKSGVEIGAGAAALCEKVATQQNEMAAKAPMIADTLIECGVIDILDKESTVKLLQDPGKTLEIVGRLGKQASKPRSMGSSEKTASEPYDPQNPPPAPSHLAFENRLNSGPGASV